MYVCVCVCKCMCVGVCIYMLVPVLPLPRRSLLCVFRDHVLFPAVSSSPLGDSSMFVISQIDKIAVSHALMPEPSLRGNEWSGNLATAERQRGLQLVTAGRQSGLQLVTAGKQGGLRLATAERQGGL